MIEYIFSPDLQNASTGIYRIDFSNGFFYIGKSVNLKKRIKLHVKAINSDFTCPETCISLKKMKKFKGVVTFSLLEAVDLDGMTRQTGINHILDRETCHIVAFRDDKRCLNWLHNAHRRKQPNVC